MSAASEAPAIRFVGDVERLVIQPGDRFVISAPFRLSDHGRQIMAEVWAEFSGGAPLLILEEGLRLSVVAEAGAGVAP